jgi:hypothetical protein
MQGATAIFGARVIDLRLCDAVDADCAECLNDSVLLRRALVFLGVRAFRGERGGKTPPGLRRRRLPSVAAAARSQAFGSINVNYRTKTPTSARGPMSEVRERLVS